MSRDLRLVHTQFYESLHERVEIAEGVIRMLTRRLREATRTIAGGTRTIPPPESQL